MKNAASAIGLCTESNTMTQCNGVYLKKVMDANRKITVHLYNQKVYRFPTNLPHLCSLSINGQ